MSRDGSFESGRRQWLQTVNLWVGGWGGNRMLRSLCSTQAWRVPISYFNIEEWRYGVFLNGEKLEVGRVEVESVGVMRN